MPRSINDSDDFFDWLTSTKDANLNRVRNSAVMPSSGPKSPVVTPTPEEPNLITDYKETMLERKASEAESRAIQEQNIVSDQGWNKWQEKRAMPFIVGGLAYYFFFR